MPGVSASVPAVLFVCLGNICRSPMAEGALRARAAAAGVAMVIDSAGTGDWHAGEPPDARAMAAARHHGVDISAQRARRIASADFHRFTHILAADHDNLATLLRNAPARGTRPALLLDLLPGHEGQAVPDPYWGDDAAFHAVWSLLDRAAIAIVAQLTAAGASGQSLG